MQFNSTRFAGAKILELRGESGSSIRAGTPVHKCVLEKGNRKKIVVKFGEIVVPMPTGLVYSSLRPLAPRRSRLSLRFIRGQRRWGYSVSPLGACWNAVAGLIFLSVLCLLTLR